MIYSELKAIESNFLNVTSHKVCRKKNALWEHYSSTVHNLSFWKSYFTKKQSAGELAIPNDMVGDGLGHRLQEKQPTCAQGVWETTWSNNLL